MDRRNVLKVALGTMTAGGAGAAAILGSSSAKPTVASAPVPSRVGYEKAETQWHYTSLSPIAAAQAAYRSYDSGGCMYGMTSGIISELANALGEPYRSFPLHMMKYGHGGIGGAGTICGTLNGAAAIMGLLIDNKKVRDTLTADLFHWYENTAFPVFEPQEAIVEFTPPTSVSQSVLCHVSTTRWGDKSGVRIKSKERVERCRRLTADVASQTVKMLNGYFDDAFVAQHQSSPVVNECMGCHGSDGKLGNTTGKMNCTSCHEGSLGHDLFGEIHYEMMDKRP